MLNISKLLVESMKRHFNNRDAVLAVLRELKTKETLLAKTESRSAEMQYKLLKKMQSEREDALKIYQDNNRIELANKEKNELIAINQFISLVQEFLPKQMTEAEIKSEILNNKTDSWTIRDVMQYFKTKYPLTDKKLVSKIAKEIL